MHVVEITVCDLSHEFHKQITNMSHQVLIISMLDNFDMSLSIPQPMYLQCGHGLPEQYMVRIRAEIKTLI